MHPYHVMKRCLVQGCDPASCPIFITTWCWLQIINSSHSMLADMTWAKLKSHTLVRTTFFSRDGSSYYADVRTGLVLFAITSSVIFQNCSARIHCALAGCLWHVHMVRANSLNWENSPVSKFSMHLLKWIWTVISWL